VLYLRRAGTFPRSFRNPFSPTTFLFNDIVPIPAPGGARYIAPAELLD
jgi:hypothetical protein